MSWMVTRPHHHLVQTLAKSCATAVHVDHLDVADGKDITRRFIEDIQFNLANAKIKLLIQRQMFVVDRPGRVRIRGFQSLPERL